MSLYRTSTPLLCCLLLASAACGSKDSTSSDTNTTVTTDPTGGTTTATTDGTCVPLPDPSMTGVFAAVDGSADATGTQSDPVDLVTALSEFGPVQPGDTLWIAAGTYAGDFTADLNGTEANPIVVRPHPGARVILDTETEGAVVINGSYTDYHDLEVLSSSGDRESIEDSSGPTDIALGGGVTVYGARVRVINFEVHDTSGGFSFWTPAVDSTLYGNMIYNNGWTAPGRGHGHAIYTQNLDGTKNLDANIIFFGFGTGVHAYTEGGAIQGFEVNDNVWFHTGASDPRSSQRKDNCLIGGFQPVARTVLRRNLGWSLGRGTRLGYGGDVNNLDVTFEDNYLVEHLWLYGNWDSVSMTGNTFMGDRVNVDPADYPGNDFTDGPPESGQRIFVYENQHDDGRARVTIYNWDQDAAVSVDLGGVLQDGEQYQIFSVFDTHGSPVTSGIFDGSAVEIPMGTVAPPQPTGLPDGIADDDDPGRVFGVFLVRHLGCQ